MARVYLIVALTCFMGLASAQQTYPAYFYPVEHRNALTPVMESFPAASYEYSIIPSDQYADYAVAEYDPTAFSFLDYIPNPITAITTIGSKALSVICKALSLVKGVLGKVGWIALGMALVLGFCAFTPYCTLIIEKPFAGQLRSLADNYPYLDYVENLIGDAYTKFTDMRNE